MRGTKKQLKMWAAGVGIGLLGGLLVLGVPHGVGRLGELLDGFEAKMLDLRFALSFRVQGEKPPIEDLVIVDIDSRSLYKLGRYRQWPRSYHARLMDFLSKGGALAVGFDVLFVDPDRDPQEDAELIRATRKAGHVFHAVMFSGADSSNFLYAMREDPFRMLNPESSYGFDETIHDLFPRKARIEGAFPELARASAGLGCVNIFPDRDGVTRSMPLFVPLLDRMYAALGMKMALDLLGVQEQHIGIVPGEHVRLTLRDGETVDIPIDKDGRMLIHYTGNYRSFRYISYYDVLEQRIPARFFEGKIVLVGASAPGLMDLRSVPFSAQFPGVEIHANVLHTILSGDFLRKADFDVVALIVLLSAVLTGILALTLSPLYGGIGIVLCWMVYAYFSLFTMFEEHNFWLELTRPTLAVLFVYISAIVFRYLTEELEKRRVKGFFQTYVSPELVERMLEDPALAELGGRRQEVTVFFSDIAGFTTISEGMEPDELVPFLNEYLTAMTEIVLKYGGTVDKFEGDAVMAFFGAPVPLPNHALAACKVALEMQETLGTLRKKWAEEGLPEVRIRIGLDTGDVVVGNMGSKDKMDYTVMGDHVNTASRLEGVNKMYGTAIMFSEHTYARVKEEVIVRELDVTRVKGKNEALRIYELLALRSEGVSKEVQEKVERYTEALTLYRDRQWTAAEGAFRQILEGDSADGPSKTYAVRCRNYQENPPAEPWDGVWVMDTK
ncbi:MAG: adenylate/guanylate cyclase domain-containing protein [Candidatus Latescibacteria bacterium]|nr:adenylate/guanylate cyclase domain-containing protein [Candidatus Latescibacterota bacterium]